MRQQIGAVHDETFEPSNTEDASRLSYGGDHQHSASVASAEFGQTVITTIRIIAETENSETHIHVCASDVDIDQVTSVERS